MDAQDSIRGISDSLCAVAESPHPKKIPQKHVRVSIPLLIFIKKLQIEKKIRGLLDPLKSSSEVQNLSSFTVS